MNAGTFILGVYVVGVLWGLLVGDARPMERVIMAMLWPLGPIAFVITVTILLMALPVAFPRVGIPFWMIAGILAWVALTR